MRILWSVVVAGALVGVAQGQTASQMPEYSAETVVCHASLRVGPLTPNALVSIFGKNLAWVTRHRRDEDAAGGVLPLILPGTSVMVMVNGLAAPVEMVSPEQVMFLMPPNLRAGEAEVRLVHAGRAGPGVKVEVAESAPELFVWEEGVALARDPETMEWVEPGAPAGAGRAVVLYAAGLGETEPVLGYREMPMEPAEIAARDDLVVWLNDEVVGEIGYVGVMPGFPGLYEIWLRLPDMTPSNPRVRLQMGEHMSRDEIRLAVDGYQVPEGDG